MASFDSIQGAVPGANIGPGANIVRIDRLIALTQFYGCCCMSVLSCWFVWLMPLIKEILTCWMVTQTFGYVNNFLEVVCVFGARMCEAITGL